MNHYIYLVSGEEASRYLGGTNYVGVWADTQAQANLTVVKYFKAGTPITSVTKHQVQGQVGYLY